MSWLVWFYRACSRELKEKVIKKWQHSKPNQISVARNNRIGSQWESNYNRSTRFVSLRMATLTFSVCFVQSGTVVCWLVSHHKWRQFHLQFLRTISQRQFWPINRLEFATVPLAGTVTSFYIGTRTNQPVFDCKNSKKWRRGPLMTDADDGCNHEAVCTRQVIFMSGLRKTKESFPQN